MCRFMVATQAALRPLNAAPAATRHRRMQVFRKPEGTQLLDHILVVSASAAGHQILHLGILVNKPAEPQVGHITLVHGLNILGFNYIPQKLLRRIIAQFRTVQDLCQTFRCQRQIEFVQHGNDVRMTVIHLSSHSSCRLRRFFREYL